MNFIELNMNQLPSFSKEINDIYFIANTPSSFYRMMRENYFIRTQLSPLPADFLIAEFKKLASQPADSSEEVAKIYAIFIAITFKPVAEVKDFFEESLNIKFEWFSYIANNYLQNPPSDISYQSISFTPVEIKQGTTQNPLIAI